MRAREYLLEYNRQKTAQNYGDKIIMIARRDPTLNPQLKSLQNVGLLDAVLSMIEQSDPTKNKEYSQGLAKLYSNGGIRFEDLGSTISDYLTKFHKLKVKRMIPPPYNDFLRYAKITDVMDVVDQLPDPDSDKQETNKGSAKEYFNNEEIRVIIPEDETAACYYGQGTRWCTAAKNHNMFDHYASIGTLYIIIPKHPERPGEKYQIHFEENQCMDPSDTPVSISSLVERFPSMRKAFAKQGKEFGIISLMSDEEQAKLSAKGEAYIQAHGVDHGDGIVTVSLNEPNAEIQDYSVNSRVANLVNAVSSKFDFNIPVGDPGEGNIVAAYAVIDTKSGKDNTFIVWGEISYDGQVTVHCGKQYDDHLEPHNLTMRKVIEDISELLNVVLDSEEVDFDRDDPWEVHNEALEQLRQKFGD
jgi:uncharacterized protein YjgD (DUF1641 family)